MGYKLRPFDYSHHPRQSAVNACVIPRKIGSLNIRKCSCEILDDDSSFVFTQNTIIATIFFNDPSVESYYLKYL